MNAQPKSLIPRGIKNPAECNAHPYKTIHPGTSNQIGNKLSVCKTRNGSPATNPANNGGANAWATRRVGEDQSGS